MRSVFLLMIACLLGSSSLQAQAAYYKFKETLGCISCRDTSSDSAALNRAARLERYISENPEESQAVYDLGMVYSSIARRDSAGIFNAVKAIHCFERYAQFAPASKRYMGYWNLAMMHSYLGQCDLAIKNLFKARQACKKEENWDTESEEQMKAKCR